MATNILSHDINQTNVAETRSETLIVNISSALADNFMKERRKAGDFIEHKKKPGVLLTNEQKRYERIKKSETVSLEKKIKDFIGKDKNSVFKLRYEYTGSETENIKFDDNEFLSSLKDDITSMKEFGQSMDLLDAKLKFEKLEKERDDIAKDRDKIKEDRDELDDAEAHARTTVFRNTHRFTFMGKNKHVRTKRKIARLRATYLKDDSPNAKLKYAETLMKRMGRSYKMSEGGQFKRMKDSISDGMYNLYKNRPRLFRKPHIDTYNFVKMQDSFERITTYLKQDDELQTTETVFILRELQRAMKELEKEQTKRDQHNEQKKSRDALKNFGKTKIRTNNFKQKVQGIETDNQPLEDEEYDKDHAFDVFG